MSGISGQLLGIFRHIRTVTTCTVRCTVPTQSPLLTSTGAAALTGVVTTRSYASKPPSKYAPPSPYKNPGPRNYGYENKLFGGGKLPRLDTPVKSLPEYKVNDSWVRKKALFGQNDYIDLLGDSSIHPVDLIKGPQYLIGFKGNEMQRLTRKLKFDGEMLKNLYPTEYANTQKRLRFLYKRMNHRRGKR